MVDASCQSAESELRSTLAEFLNSRSPWLPAIGTALSQLPSRPEVFLFGGLLRDLSVLGLEARPRDVDLVVGGATSESLATVFGRYVQRATRFGGLQLAVMGVEVDVWPLESTWAFRVMELVKPTFADLPKTTFLNVEAIVAEIILENTGVGRMFSAGFFEALVRRVIEINFEANPYPKLCVARSLDLASRLNFSIGPQLKEFVTAWMSRLGESELVEAHRAAHGVSVCPTCLFRAWKTAIEMAPSNQPVSPPILAPLVTPDPAILQ